MLFCSWMNETFFCKWNWNNREKRKRIGGGALEMLMLMMMMAANFHNWSIAASRSFSFISFQWKKYRSSFYFSILQQKISFFFFRKITRWSELIDLRKKMYLACLNKTDDQSCLSKHQHFAWSKDSFTNRTFASFEADFCIQIPYQLKWNEM